MAQFDPEAYLESIDNNGNPVEKPDTQSGFDPQAYLDSIDDKGNPVAQAVGQQPQVQAPEDDGNVVEDFGRGLAVGANQLLKTGGDLYGLATGDTENWATDQGQSGVDYWRKGLSKETLQAEQEVEEAVEADTGGELSKFGTSMWETLKRPRLLSTRLAEQGANLFTMGGAGMAVGAGLKAAGAGAKAAGIGATSGAVGTGGVLQGSDVGASTYEEIMQIPQDKWEASPDYKTLVGNGATPDEAKKQIALDRARVAGTQGFATSVLTNLGLPWGRVLERVASGAGAGALKGGALKRFGKGTVGEMTQEALEEGSGKVFTNLGVQGIDPERGAWEGVGHQAGQGAIIAGPLGGIAGLASGDRPVGVSGSTVNEGLQPSTPEQLSKEFEWASNLNQPEMKMLGDIRNILRDPNATPQEKATASAQMESVEGIANRRKDIGWRKLARQNTAIDIENLTDDQEKTILNSAEKLLADPNATGSQKALAINAQETIKENVAKRQQMQEQKVVEDEAVRAEAADYEKKIDKVMTKADRNGIARAVSALADQNLPEEEREAIIEFIEVKRQELEDRVIAIENEEEVMPRIDYGDTEEDTLKKNMRRKGISDEEFADNAQRLAEIQQEKRETKQAKKEEKKKEEPVIEAEEVEEAEEAVDERTDAQKILDRNKRQALEDELTDLKTRFKEGEELGTEGVQRLGQLPKEIEAIQPVEQEEPAEVEPLEIENAEEFTIDRTPGKKAEKERNKKVVRKKTEMLKGFADVINDPNSSEKEIADAKIGYTKTEKELNKSLKQGKKDLYQSTKALDKQKDALGKMSINRLKETQKILADSLATFQNEEASQEEREQARRAIVEINKQVGGTVQIDTIDQAEAVAEDIETTALDAEIESAASDLAEYIQEEEATAEEEAATEEVVEEEVVEEEATEPVEEQVATEEEATPDVEEEATEEEKVKTIADTIYEKFADGEPSMNNNALRKLVGEFDGTPTNEVSQERMKEAQEAVEVAVTRKAREIVESGGNEEDIYASLVDLYRKQPLLNIRSSTSIENQAYSTPAPIAYIASQLAGIDNKSVVYEPTAGNGMLLVGANIDNAVVNELNDQRVENLRELGFSPQQKDAVSIIDNGDIKPKSADVVITNPPFGGVKGKKEVDGYKISKIDHLIAAKSLSAMKDDGKAALIIGADKQAGNMSEADRIFFNWLYSNYNVTDNFEVEGKLYSRQGAGWPIRIITIDGRKKSKTLAPDPATIDRVGDWASLYDRYQQSGETVQAETVEQPEEKKPTKKPVEKTEQKQELTGLDAAEAEINAKIDDAALELAAYLKKSSGTLNTGVDPKLLFLGTKLASLYVQKGFVKFAQFSKAIMNKLKSYGVDPNAIKPALKDMYGAVQGQVSDEIFDQMDDMRTVRKFDLDSINLEEANDEETTGVDTGGTGNTGATTGEGATEQEGDKTGVSGQPGAKTGGSTGGTGTGRAGTGGRASTGTAGTTGQQDTGTDSGNDNGVGTDAISDEQGGLGQPGQQEATEQLTAEGDAGRNTGLNATVDGSEFQAPYESASSLGSDGALIPINMKTPLEDALAELKAEVGDLDEYVKEKLGYTDEELKEAFGTMGLQVDSVAAAIYNIDNNKGIIIADQTGIGKGRQAAAILRYAKRKGKTPIFMTVKKDLFTDMYGDLSDIGSGDANPYIVNANYGVTNRNVEEPTEDELAELGVTARKKRLAKYKAERTLFKLGDTERNKRAKEIIRTGKLPKDNDMMFTTYSQIQTEKNNQQKQMLTALQDNAIFVMDEAHSAGGSDSHVGVFMRGALSEADGVTYLSATYAKRPDNMPIYMKTDLSLAFDSVDELVEAVQAGGLGLQTIASNMLTQNGQLFRRERSYADVSIKTKVDTKNKERHTEISDNVNDRLRSIVEVDKYFHDNFVSGYNDEVKAEGKRVTGQARTAAGVRHNKFSSVVHNAIRQFVVAVKAESAAESALEAMENNQKPVITLESTMGSFLDEYIADNNLKDGDTLEGFDYRTVLSRALKRTRRVTVTDERGQKTIEEISLSELDPATRMMYDSAQNLIDSLDTEGIPVSPIDWVRYRLNQKKKSVKEITGRKFMIDYSGAEPVLRKRPAEENDRVKTRDEFNDGDLDAIILNVAGSTGISLHASERYKDQSKRQMIVMQPALDINTFMQTLGRVHRTGQVVAPDYTLLNLAIPAEFRPTAVLSKKMKSLNANTSSNTDSDTSVESVDIMNKYGDEKVMEYLRSKPGLATQLGINLEGHTGFNVAQEATGRLALLPVEEQEKFYADVNEMYTSYINYLNETGQNELVIKTRDLDAKPVSETELTPERDPSNIFGKASNLTRFDVKLEGKIPNHEEVKSAVDETLKGKTPEAYSQAILDEMAGYSDEQKTEKSEEINEITNTLRTGELSPGKVANLENRQDNLRNEIRQLNEDASEMNTLLTRIFEVGSKADLEINGQKFVGVVTDITARKIDKGNPYAKSKTTITFAVNDAMRKVNIPLSQLRGGEEPVFKGINRSNIEDTFSFENASQSREKRYIVTGNLLSAYSELNEKGEIISFTKDDGSVVQGILMPKSFNVDEGVKKDVNMRYPEAAYDFLSDNAGNRDVSSYGISSRDGNIRVVPGDNPGEIIIRTHKAKAKGGRWFGDKGLTSITGDFVSARGSKMMSVTVRDRDTALRALNHIMAKSSLHALPSMADKAQPYIDKYTKEGKAYSRKRSAPSKKKDKQKVKPRSKKRDKRTGATVNGVKKWLEKPLSKLGKWVDVEVVQKVDDLPGENHPADVKGMMINGKIYIVADNTTKEDAEQTLAHEAVGHLGLEKLLGRDQFGQVLKQIQSMKKTGNKRVLNIVNELRQNYVDENGNYNLDERQESREILAHLAEKHKGLMIVRRVKAAIKKWLARMGFGNVDDAYINSLITQAASLTQQETYGFSEDIANNRIQERPYNRPFQELAYSRIGSEAMSLPGIGKLNISPSTEKNAKRAKDNIQRWFKRNMTKEGLLGETGFELKLESDAIKNVGEQEIEAMMHDFQAKMKEGYDAKTYNAINQSDLADVDAYLKGDESVSIPAEVKEVADVMRDYIDSYSDKMVTALDDLLAIQVDDLSPTAYDEYNRYMSTNGKKGKLPKKIESLFRVRSKIIANKGQYLHRSYQAFDDPKWMRTAMENADLMERAEDYIKEMNPSFDDDEVRGAVMGILQDAQDAGNFPSLIAKGSKVGNKDISILKRKNDKLPPIMLELLGEYEDPRVNFARTVSKMQYYLANHHFLTKLREEGLGTFLFKNRKSNEFGDFIKPIAGKGSETMNPLNGLYTTPDMVQGMEDMIDKFEGSDLMRMLVRGNSAVKYGKTILSPTTQFRNFWSAAMFSVMNGHFNWLHGNKAFHATMADLATKDADWRKYLNKLIKLGVIHNNPYSQELREAITDMAQSDISKQYGNRWWGIKSMANFAQKSYQAGDDFWKIIGYENEVAMQKRNGATQKEAEETAAYRIRNGYPTYSMVPRGIKKVRRWLLIGTFVSFPWEIMRTTYNQAQFLREDAKNNKEAFLRRATGLGLASALAHTASVLSMGAFGLDGDDDEAVRAQLPEWSRNSQLLYTGYDKDGLPTYMDLSHIDPYTYLKKPITALMNNNNKGIGNKITDAMMEAFSPYFGPDIAAGSIFEVIANKKSSGGPVYNPTDTKPHIAKTVVNHLRKSLQPGVLSNTERTMKALSGDASTSGKEYVTSDEMIAWIGFRLGTLNLQQSMIYKGYGFANDLRKSTELLSKVAGSQSNISNSDLESGFERMNSARVTAYNEMIKYINGARRLNVPENDIFRALKGSGISKKDTAHLMRGTIPPWIMSRSFIKTATERAMTSTPSQEKRREIMDKMRSRRAYIIELMKRQNMNY